MNHSDRRLLLPLCFWALLFGCRTFDRALLDGGGVDGPDWDGPERMCTSRQPPPRPTPGNDADVGEVFFGVKDVVLDQTENDVWRHIGFDLDRICTTPPDPPIACVPASSTASPELDGVDGIDNSFGDNFFPLVRVVLPTVESDANLAMESGEGAILIRIRGWNGTPNDDRIEVMVTQTVFGVATPDGVRPTVTFAGAEATFPDGSPAPPPAWDGRDFFWARSDSFLDGDPEIPHISDDNAYVADGLFVANLPDRSLIRFSSLEQGIDILLIDALMTGSITTDGQGIDDLLVAGRWALTDILATAETLGLCRGEAEYNILHTQLELVADVRDDAGEDGMDLPCNAMSFGVLFTGYRANFGGTAEPLTFPSLCEPSGDAGMPTEDAGTLDAAAPDAGVAADAAAPDGGAGA